MSLTDESYPGVILPWTKEDTDIAIRMAHEGKNSREIGEVVNRTPKAVRGRLGRFGVRLDKITKAHANVPAVKKVRSMPKLKEEAAIPESRRVTLMELDAHTCRWPIGDPRSEDFCFCGAYVSVDDTYCQPHREIAFYSGYLDDVV